MSEPPAPNQISRTDHNKGGKPVRFIRSVPWFRKLLTPPIQTSSAKPTKPFIERNSVKFIGGYCLLLFFLVYNLNLKAARLVDPELNWSIYVTIAVVLAGTIFSFYGAIQSTQAAKKAEQAASEADEIRKELTITSVLAGLVEDDYSKVFNKHIEDPIMRLTEGGLRVESAKLLLSTPSYGNPPLKEFYLSEFIGKILGEIEIIFFSPDAHYIHWANSLLWQPLASGDDFKLKAFCERADKTCTALEGLQDTRKKVRIWITAATPIRMTYFEARGNAPEDDKVLGFLVLADAIELGNNLEDFCARSFQVHRSWFKSLFGNDGRSGFFDGFKTCPYSRGARVQKELTRAEVEHYRTDLAFGRTNQLQFMPSQLHQIIVDIEAKTHYVDLAKDALCQGAKTLWDIRQHPHFAGVRGGLLEVVLQSLFPNGDTANPVIDWTTNIDFDMIETACIDNEEQIRVVNEAKAFYSKKTSDPKAIWTTSLYLLMASGFGLSSLANSRLNVPVGT